MTIRSKESNYSDNFFDQPCRAPDYAILFERIAAGDETALALLYDRTSPLLFGLLLKMLRNKGAAETTLEAVYTEVWRTAADFDETCDNPFARLFKITHRHGIARLRSNRTNFAQPREIFDENTGDANPVRSIVSNRAIRSEDERLITERKRVRTAFAELSPVQQDVIELAYFYGLTQKEIALRIDRPPKTVKREMLLGMQKLRAELEQNG